jgi:excisionase family DNA binding protein
MTVADVATRLSVSRSTVHRLVTSGSLPRVKVGRRSVRYRTTDVERLVDRGMRTPPDHGTTL